MKLYHYTIADRLVKIMIDGYLKLTPRLDSEYHEKGELRSVWLTVNPEWDDTAFYGYPGEVLDSAGRIRITVEADDDCFHSVVYADQLHNYQDLCASAMSVGVNFLHWHISVKEIKMERFLSVELWKDGEWVQIPTGARKVYAENEIFGLTKQIKDWQENGAISVEVSVTDLGLLRECYLEDLQELEGLQVENTNLADENKQMAEYLLCTGLSQEKIDEICNS